MLEKSKLRKKLEPIPLVSVVILNHNGLKYLGKDLAKCLDSVMKTLYSNLEIIFVDNGSIDGSADFVRKNYGSRIRIIANEQNLGFSEGFNKGIKISNGKYVVLLSNDMAVDPNWIKPVVHLMESDPSVGLVGFKRLVMGTTNILDGIGSDLCLCGRVKPVGTKELDIGQYDTEIDNLDFIGGAMALRRKTLQQAGLLDSDFTVFSEDVDLCFRIRKKGYRIVYLYTAVLWHRAHSTLVGIDSKGQYLEYMSNQNRIRCNIIHFTLRRLFSSFLIDAVLFLIFNSTSKWLLLNAYFWNLKKINMTLKKRLIYGRSPPYECKYPVLPFSFQDLWRRLKTVGMKN